jgi:hypothetical protein
MACLPKEIRLRETIVEPRWLICRPLPALKHNRIAQKRQEVTHDRGGSSAVHYQLSRTTERRQKEWKRDLPSTIATSCTVLVQRWTGYRLAWMARYAATERPALFLELSDAVRSPYRNRPKSSASRTAAPCSLEARDAPRSCPRPPDRTPWRLPNPISPTQAYTFLTTRTLRQVGHGTVLRRGDASGACLIRPNGPLEARRPDRLAQARQAVPRSEMLHRLAPHSWALPRSPRRSRPLPRAPAR